MSFVDIRPLYDWKRGLSGIKRRSNAELTRAIPSSGINSFPWDTSKKKYSQAKCSIPLLAKVEAQSQEHTLLCYLGKEGSTTHYYFLGWPHPCP